MGGQPGPHPGRNDRRDPDLQEALKEKPGFDDEKKELSERAKLIMKRADELVEQHKFKEALEVMEQGLKQDATLQKEKEYMDKLGVVTKAASAT